MAHAEQGSNETSGVGAAREAEDADLVTTLPVGDDELVRFGDLVSETDARRALDDVLDLCVDVVEYARVVCSDARLVVAALANQSGLCSPSADVHDVDTIAIGQRHGSTEAPDVGRRQSVCRGHELVPASHDTPLTLVLSGIVPGAVEEETDCALRGRT